MQSQTIIVCHDFDGAFADQATDSIPMWHGRHADPDHGSVDQDEERRILQMIRAGLGAAEVAWALERPIDAIEARLKLLSIRFGGEGGKPKPAAHTAARPETPAGPVALALNASPLAQASRALDGRVEIIDGRIFLDDAPVSLRDLVLAAAGGGVEIPYPGVHPLPAAFHGGPSISCVVPPDDALRKHLR